MSTPFDAAAVRSHVEMLHDLAAGCDGLIPLCIFGENPDSGRKTSIVQHFRVGDVDGMTAAALAYDGHPDANVYAPLAVMRRDLARGDKGSERDVIAVLGCVIDDDADAGRPAALPIQPNYSVQSSAENRQHFFLFDRAPAPHEAKPIAEAFYRACGGDHGTKDISHVWRVPGTANWPNRKKVCERNRPREPQPVRTATPWNGDLYSPDHIRAVLAPHVASTKMNGHAHDGAPADVAGIMASLGAGVRKLITAPPLTGEDRSATLASVVSSMIRTGQTDSEIVAVIEAHPDGIGAKYVGRPDLAAEVARLREKFGPPNSEDENPPIFDPWDEYVVPAFPLDVLPGAVRRFVETQSRVIGCDAGALAMASLTALGSALSHKFSLKMLRNGDWYASPRLWTLLVGDPSRKKTPIIRAATKCLDQHEQDIWDRWEQTRDEALKDDPDAEEPPKPPRLVVGDTTVEALGEILARHDRGLLVRRDEIAGWIGSMERYGGGKGATADRAFWLQAYDGGPFTVDRIRRGEQRIRNLSVSLLGGIQPNRLKEVRDLTSDGLLQRFLPVMVGKSTFPIDEPATPKNEYRELATRLFNAIPATLIMDDAALETAAAARRRLHDLEQASSGLAAGFQAFVGKLPGVLGSFALILHMLCDPSHGSALPLSAKHVSNAARLLDEFILPHAFEFYRTADSVTDGDRLQKLASWLLTSGKARIVVSDLTSNVAGFRGLTMWEVNQRVSPLVAGGWLAPEGADPVSRAWTVNAEVFSRMETRRAEEEQRKAALAAIMRSPRRGV